MSSKKKFMNKKYNKPKVNNNFFYEKHKYV